MPILANGGASWPFVRLHLEEEAFVLGLWRFFPNWGLPSRIRYSAVAEAGLRTAFPPRIRIRLDDPSKGLIRITTLDDGAVQLADRLERRGVRVYDEADFGSVGHPERLRAPAGAPMSDLKPPPLGGERDQIS